MMNKIHSMVCALVIASGIAVQTYAATPVVDNTGALLGATGVDVGGTLYDVAFADGTCAELFGGCEQSELVMMGISSAAAAALLTQVFLDIPDVGQFDSQPELTVGCTDLASCRVWVPDTYNQGNSFLTHTYIANGASNDSISNPGLNLLVSIDSSDIANATYSIWCLAGTGCAPVVPEDPAGAENGIIGSWYNISDPDPVNQLAGGPVVLTLFENGQFQFGSDGDSIADPNGMDGLEWGTYTFDGMTLAFTALLDTNGGWGLAGASLPVTLDGNTLTIDTGDGDFVFDRVNSDSLVGGWMAEGPVDDETVTIAFLDNGTFMLTHGNNPGDTCGCGQAGIEFGNYTWDPVTDAISFTIITDTNGEFGVSHPFQGTYESLIQTGDQFVLADGEGSATFYRIRAADEDEDGVPNFADNCTNKFNPEQDDSNGDGIGTSCDQDINNDCVVNFIDFGLLVNTGALFSMPGDAGWNPDYDFNSDEVFNFLDVGAFGQAGVLFSPPGPSANACIPF